MMMEAALDRRGDDLATLMSAHIMGVLDLLRDGFQGAVTRRAATSSSADRARGPRLAVSNVALDDSVADAASELRPGTDIAS